MCCSLSHPISLISTHISNTIIISVCCSLSHPISLISAHVSNAITISVCCSLSHPISLTSTYISNTITINVCCSLSHPISLISTHISNTITKLVLQLVTSYFPDQHSYEQYNHYKPYIVHCSALIISQAHTWIQPKYLGVRESFPANLVTRLNRPHALSCFPEFGDVQSAPK